MGVRLLLVIWLAALTPSMLWAADEEFPLRKEFPEVVPVSIQKLHADLDNTIVVDVRSHFEFETVHINGAKHIPVATIQFLAELQAQVEKDRKVAFYCNGHTCAKSYKATRKAIALGYTEALVFDAGIFEWASTYPEQTTFLGKSPADTEKLLASKKDFAKRSLDFGSFKAKAAEANAMVIDIREPFQRSKESDRSVKIDLPELPQRVRYIPLNNMQKLLEKGIYKDKMILIYDATGKQVKWLQYHLQNEGYTNYFFLKGGAYKVTGISSS